MSGVPLQGHELVGHIFLLLDGPVDHRFALDLWDRCVTELGSTESIGPHPTRLPDAPPPVADGESVVAACSAGTPGVVQLTARRVHDVLCVSVVCAPERTSGWADLDALWTRLRGGRSRGVLGSVGILQARLADPVPPTALASALAEVDPPALVGRDPRRRWSGGVLEPQPRPGLFAVWESLDADADEDASRRREDRRLLVVAPAERDGELSELTWNSQFRRVTPFTHYLLHAAKLRYGVRVRASMIKGLPAMRADVDGAYGELMPLVAAGRPVAGPAGAGVRQRTFGLNATGLALAHRHSLLGELRESVRAADHNMALYAGGDRATGLFADDREVATWLLRQIEDDLVRIDGPRNRLRDLVAAVTPLLAERAGAGDVPHAPLTAQQQRMLAESLEGGDRLHPLLAGAVADALSDGRIAELVTRALLGDPGNPHLGSLVAGGLLDLDSAVAAARDGARDGGVDGALDALAGIRPPARVFARRDGRQLEHVVRELDGYQNPAVFWNGLQAGVRRVCLVDVPGPAREGGGTGFLVGPDLVLTNHHVVAAVIDGGADPSAVRCVFDHLVGPDGAIEDGVRVRLHDDWLVASSPPGAADDQVDPPAPPGPGELDYALVRLAGPVPGEPARGWFDLLADPPPVRPDRTLLVLQHPDGHRLKMGVGPVVGVNSNRTRVTHLVNTASGSSGGPCLTLDMRLAALHHAGSPRDPDDPGAPKVNAAVPIEAIRRHLVDGGHRRVLTPTVAD